MERTRNVNPQAQMAVPPVSAARQRGTNGENAVVAALQRLGWPHAERRALAGNRDKGDIAGLPGVCLEVKAAKRMELGAWLRELDKEMVNDKADTGALWVKPIGKTQGEDYYVVMRPAVWAALMRQAGWQ
jgi:hypothetical protein